MAEIGSQPQSTRAQGDADNVDVLAAERIDAACRHAVVGKLALRDLAAWVRGFGVNEGEFRLLWLLFQRDQQPAASRQNCDQAEMALQLAVSPAQVSCSVERLQQRNLIQQIETRADRRKQFWKLAPEGATIVLAVLQSVKSRGLDAHTPAVPPAASLSEATKEAA